MKNTEYDLSKIIELADHDMHFLQSMVVVFLKEIPEDLICLEQAIAAGDRFKTHQYAHKIKPSIEVFGMPCLNDILLIEAWGKSQDPMDITPYFKSAQAQLNRAMAQLNSDF